MAGFHLEGPWISSAPGPLGAHPREHVRPAEIEEFKVLQEAASGNIRLVTLAPEITGALVMIEYLTREGVRVSIGHSGADASQIRDAVAAGATLSTHLGNAAPGELPRRQNLIFAQLAADELSASFIADDFHLTPEFLKVAVRAKGTDRTILVTDAVPPAGCPPGIYRCGPLEVELTAAGRVELTPTRRLAGSALRLDQAIGNLIRLTGVSLADAVKAATVNPARALGLGGSHAAIETDEPTDWVLFRLDESGGGLSVESVITGSARSARR
jgi:N-acetylglucosamine-6-phosphate deacetylase